jgi:hypothetical protein
MISELNKDTEISKALKQEAYLKERTNFRLLLLSNANYFGNLIKSPLKHVLPITKSTYYEELECVGYHPQLRRLEAVVYIYQPTGFGSDICGSGTPEFVRFYLSLDNGKTWQDQGITCFQAYNIPEGTKGRSRLEYAVSLEINPDKKICLSDPLIRVRAILSWNNQPPANQPDWSPVWGNVKEAEILVEPSRRIAPHEIFDLAHTTVPQQLKEIIDLDAPIQTKKETLGAAELAVKYKDEDVPVHRFAFKEISAAISSQSSLSAESLAALLPGIKINPEIVDVLFPKTDGNTSYEELKCIGLDPNFPDTLVGVIHVKKPSGYSGGPCSNGSQEYVTFWADFDGNGSFEKCLGTASVRVYDLSRMPAEGVYYAVRLPVELSSYRQPCKNGPKVVRIRAILSWNHAISCRHPNYNYVPTWGNREETLINIAPQATADDDVGIRVLGGIPVEMIDADGLTTPGALLALSNFPPDDQKRPCPFGGRVSVQGPEHLDLGKSYKVEVTPVGGGAPTAVVTDLTLVRHDELSTYMHKADKATLRFDYVKDNFENLLAQWDTTVDGQWDVTLTIFDGPANDANALPKKTFTHRIMIDNTPPEASIYYDKNLITTEAGRCGKFDIGKPLSGTFVAHDDYLRQYHLYILPGDVNTAPAGVPIPSTGYNNTAPNPSDKWELPTVNMKPCGYVIVVQAIDRAILDSARGSGKCPYYGGHYSYDSIGFCLKKATTVVT